MAQKIIDLGTSPNKGDGDPLRTAFTKINDNFTELYTGSPIVPQDLRGSVFGDDSTLLVDGVNSSIPKANIEDSTNWDTAFGWGNHSTAGYLTSYTVTQADVTTHQAALSITESQITDLAHYDDTALATRVSTLENAGYITSETDSQELTLVGTDLSISSGNTVDLSGFLTSVPAQTFASLTGTPTTIAGYGITDALELGTTSTTALAGNTALFSGAFADLTSKPTTIVGYGITDALATPGDNIALGTSSSAGTEGVGIGKGTSAGDYAQAIGNNAGNSAQGVAAVAIGSQAGETNQGDKAIAIGQYAGQTNQAANSIVLNATGAALENTTSDSMVVKPIRNASGTHQLEYNPTTGEVTYDTLGAGSFDQDLNTTDDVTFNSAALSSTLNLAALAAEPSSPVNGMVAVADGTSWDPMSNAAQTMVVYLGGAWRQIAVAGV